MLALLLPLPLPPSPQDLASEGLIALERAARGYRPGGDARFGTYAASTVWKAMQRAVHTQSRVVRLPSHHYLDMRRVRKATDALAAASSAASRPSVEELATACGFTVPYTAHLLRQMLRGEGGGRSLPPLRSPKDGAAGDASSPLDVEGVECGEAEEWERQQQEAAVAAELEMFLEQLSPKHAMAIRLRHGLFEGFDGRQLSFGQIGERMGFTGERLLRCAAHVNSLPRCAWLRRAALSPCGSRAKGLAHRSPRPRPLLPILSTLSPPKQAATRRRSTRPPSGSWRD